MDGSNGSFTGAPTHQRLPRKIVMPYAKTFRDLTVYQHTRKEAKRLFLLTTRFPKAEMFALTDQIRRSSRAVGALIAEGWTRRRYEADFVNKINQALAEANETQSWLDFALDCGYIEEDEYREIDESWQHIGAMLGRMIQCSNSFCHSPA